MFYNDVITEMLEVKSNPVNSMYLHEINIQWNNFINAIKEKNTSNEQMVQALNLFLKTLSNKKFKYNPVTKNGFKEDSPLFSAMYLNDMISVFIKRTGVTKNKGICWDYGAFSANLRFNPPNFNTMGKYQKYEQDDSVKVLQLCQKLDFQFRITGTRNFDKYQITLPLIVFYTFKNLTEDDFTKIEYISRNAKTTFEKSRSIIVTETLAEDFVPNLKTSPIDMIFILSKKFQSFGINEISTDVVDVLEKKIVKYIFEKEEKNEEFKISGYIQ